MRPVEFDVTFRVSLAEHEHLSVPLIAFKATGAFHRTPFGMDYGVGQAASSLVEIGMQSGFMLWQRADHDRHEGWHGPRKDEP